MDCCQSILIAWQGLVKTHSQTIASQTKTIVNVAQPHSFIMIQVLCRMKIWTKDTERGFNLCGIYNIFHLTITCRQTNVSFRALKSSLTSSIQHNCYAIATMCEPQNYRWSFTKIRFSLRITVPFCVNLFCYVCGMILSVCCVNKRKANAFPFCQAIRTEWFSSFVSVFSVFHFARLILFCKCMEMRGSRWTVGGWANTDWAQEEMLWNEGEKAVALTNRISIWYMYIYFAIYICYTVTMQR